MAQAAPLQFTMSLPGMQDYAVALSRFSDAISDFTPFWDDYLRDSWYRAIDTHYTTQGSSTGEPWPELSERYGMWKQKHWPGVPIGVRSGATRESLTFADDGDAIWESTPTSLTVGTRVPYALFLQLGTKGRGKASGMRKVKGYDYGTGGGMPARPPLRVTQDFIIQAAKLLQEFGVKAAKDAGL